VTSAQKFAESLGATLQWLSRYAGYPGSRLPDRVEILLCMAAAAEAESGAGPQRAGGGLGPDYDRAALRAHTLNRAHAQFKSDNSSKV
jgi:hypothetical protein